MSSRQSPPHYEVDPGLPLERCVCGHCFDCPDGWHELTTDGPCDCTPDCVLAETN